MANAVTALLRNSWLLVIRISLIVVIVLMLDVRFVLQLALVLSTHVLHVKMVITAKLLTIPAINALMLTAELAVQVVPLSVLLARTDLPLLAANVWMHARPILIVVIVPQLLQHAPIALKTIISRLPSVPPVILVTPLLEILPQPAQLVVILVATNALELESSPVNSVLITTIVILITVSVLLAQMDNTPKLVQMMVMLPSVKIVLTPNARPVAMMVQNAVSAFLDTSWTQAIRTISSALPVMLILSVLLVLTVSQHNASLVLMKTMSFLMVFAKLNLLPLLLEEP